MDPTQCLLDAESAIVADDMDEAATMLVRYQNWRDKLGFNPASVTPRHIMDKTPRDGDTFHFVLKALFVLTFECQLY
jgi:hypothetical protein